MTYIPAAQESMLTWMENFATKVAADPAAFGLEAGDAAQITADVDDFATKLALALDPATRTPPNVAAKDEAKAIALQTCRLYAQAIKNLPGISDGQLSELGLTIDDTTPTPHVAPTSHPVLSMAKMSDEQHVLRYSDSDAPSRSRAKPFGVTVLVLWRVFHDVGTSPPPADAAEFVGNFGNDVISVPNPASEVGRLVTYYARWMIQRGDMSPLSSPLTSPVT